MKLDMTASALNIHTIAASTPQELNTEYAAWQKENSRAFILSIETSANYRGNLLQGGRLSMFTLFITWTQR